MNPQPVRTDSSNAFAHHAMTIRLPGIIRDVQAQNTFPQRVHDALDMLYASVVSNAVIPRPALPAPDADMWTAAFDDRPGARWLESEWFFAEPYFFRQIVDCVRYWQTGLDPYRTIKDTELSQTTRERLEQVLSFHGDAAARIAVMLEAALWGNRADLSHPASQMSQLAIHRDDLLVDERANAVRCIIHGSGIVHLVCDNFGMELAMDLALADTLLALNLPVIMHLKMHPTYVSDATAADVWVMLAWFARQSDSPLSDVVGRLQGALDTGRLRLAPDFFWNSPYFLKNMPPRIRDSFLQGSIVILKGDANYRRAVYDTIYPVDTPLAQIVDYMPCPVLALRTLKSDPVLGIAEALAEQVAAEDDRWRVNGRRGVIQFVP